MAAAQLGNSCTDSKKAAALKSAFLEKHFHTHIHTHNIQRAKNLLRTEKSIKHIWLFEQRKIITIIIMMMIIVIIVVRAEEGIKKRRNETIFI